MQVHEQRVCTTMWSHQGTFVPQPHRDGALWWAKYINKGTYIYSYNQDIFPSVSSTARIIILWKAVSSTATCTTCLLTVYFSLRGLITCGQCLCCLFRTSPITSVSPCLWVNLASQIYEVSRPWMVALGFYCKELLWVKSLGGTGEWSLSQRAFHWQSEVSCAIEGETSSYSDYHFLIESSCVWAGRRCVPVPLQYTTFLFCGSICTLLWWDTVLSHYCTLFLKRFIQNKLYITVPILILSICIKTSLFAVITGVLNTV